jgi:hypothetical protein
MRSQYLAPRVVVTFLRFHFFVLCAPYAVGRARKRTEKELVPQFGNHGTRSMVLATSC